MEHILKNTHKEILNSESFLRKVKNKKNFIFFSDNFRKKYRKYIKYKKIFLLNYSSLYSDILVDWKSEDIILTEIKNIESSIVYITDSLETCIHIITKINANTVNQKDIINMEQRFLLTYNSQFKEDLNNWITNHLWEINREISKLQASQTKTKNIDYKAVLELQVKRLEQQIQNLSNILK